MIALKLGLDLSGFNAGAKTGSTLVDAIGGAVKIAAGRFALWQVIIDAFGAAMRFAFGTATAAIKNMFAALENARELKNMSMEAGVSISQLVGLRAAFESVGISAEEAGQSMSAMQRRLTQAAMFANGEGAKAFRILHLNARRMAEDNSPIDNFIRIREEIDKVGNAALKNELAFEIFGKSGRKMLQLDPGSLREIANLMKTQAAVMQKNVGLLDRVQSTVSLTKEKMKGFWAAFTARVIPQILPQLEQLRGFDFAKLGIKTGNLVANLLSEFQNGGTYMTLVLVKAWGLAQNVLLNVLLNAAVSFVQYLISPSTYTALASVMVGAIGGALNAVFELMIQYAKYMFDILSGIASPFKYVGDFLLGILEKVKSALGWFFRDTQGALDQATIKYGNTQYERGMAGFTDFTNSAGAMKDFATSVSDITSDISPAARTARITARNFETAPPEVGGALPAIIKSVQFVSSMAKVGGGGFVAGGAINTNSSMNVIATNARMQTSLQAQQAALQAQILSALQKQPPSKQPSYDDVIPYMY